MRWLCLRPPEQLDSEETWALQQILAEDADLAAGYQLLQQFREVIAARDLQGLNGWLEKAQGSGLPPFVSLGNGIQADRTAVEEALRLAWSNGPGEGHVHRIKLIKRQGYGRAKFDLLRCRVLAA